MITINTIDQLNTLDKRLARFMAKEDANNYLELAIALTSYSLREGHVCLDLSIPPPTELEIGDWPDLQIWKKELLSNKAVGTIKDKNKPFILTDSGKFYFQKYRAYEEQLIAAIHQRTHSNDETASGALANYLDTTMTLATHQKLAIQTAATHTLSLISGGPGTGKTTTILYLLKYLIESAENLPMIALVAPTGKAAQRINESIQSGVKSLELSGNTQEAFTFEVKTLHRLLGYRRNSAQFKHNADNPLRYDVVIVDEASMLDLPLMAKLFDAISPSTKIILLGDQHQLSSVEAGSVFGDLILAAESPESPLNNCTVVLDKNFRFSNDSTIHLVCEAIKAGDNDIALQLMQSGADDFAYQTVPEPNALADYLKSELLTHYQYLQAETDPHKALNSLTKVALLSPVRKGPYGIESLNQCIEKLVQASLPFSKRPQYFNGQPILITQNSYDTGLFNGDLGIIIQDNANPEKLYACFYNNDRTEVRKFSPSQLPSHETAYALTIHKSQGSEFDHVHLILPPIKNKILCRELLYTAISRARTKVHLLANAETVEKSINTPTTRTSGLFENLD